MGRVLLLEEKAPCRDCEEPTSRYDPQISFGSRLCERCAAHRDRAYDDYVDPCHWYHQHEPDRVCEA
jgi:hypothetical protein